ncbi:MAG TPA: RNA polymerase factor sigma-54 [Candidatus Marinimicrobia bacterium]|jgi:RNA polymerase sigma-54 factor|nr:RNA polymerase factor sigma-54 [Candidatus Neomarinimicrobiota bacterium]
MMQLSQSQVQKLSQELRLTPQQILQSTILQLNTLALEARVLQELEQNPVLEEVNPEVSESSEEELQDNQETSQEDDIDWEEILPQNDDYTPKEERDSDQKKTQFVQPAPKGLVDHIFDQLKLHNLDDEEERIAAEIVWNLDENGYLTLPIENIAFGLGLPQKKVLKVLKEIQELDPPGLAARDLKECLLIQLNQIPNSDDAIKVISEYFEDFANHRYQNIMKAYGWDKERMQAVQEMITKLNPKPGATLNTLDPQYIVPDLIVEKVDGEYIVEVNDTRIPELQISSTYLQMISNGSKIDNETKNYLKRKIDNAKWFIQAIQQRRLTMIRVMKAIIARQLDFFEDPSKPLKPMILKDIADDVNMDISTISRVTNNKYVQLPSGIYELKYFFNEGIKDEDGEEISTRIVKEKLKEIIDNEDKHKPYSDEQLSNLLKQNGYLVARRTVAKYREQMKIPVARLRRVV